MRFKSTLLLFIVLFSPFIGSLFMQPSCAYNLEQKGDVYRLEELNVELDLTGGHWVKRQGDFDKNNYTLLLSRENPKVWLELMVDVPSHWMTRW